MVDLHIKVLQLWIIGVTCVMTQGLEHSNVTPDNASKFKLTTIPDLLSKDKQSKEVDKSVASDSNSESLSGEIDSAVQHEIMVNYPSSTQTQVSSYRIPREHIPRSNSFVYPKKKSRKIRPGQYVSKGQTSGKNKNRKSWSDYIKSAIDSSDSNVAWSYWEYEDEEPDDADDSKMTTKTKAAATTTPSTTTTTTTTTSTTAAPTTTTTAKDKTTSSVTVHKHFHYFKKPSPWAGDPWKGDKAMATSAPSPPPMPMEEMMKMTDDMMEEMMMKGMMMIPSHDDQDKKKGGISGIFDKLSKVEPITILVAGIIPASLILAAALPSVMSKMMPVKGDTSMPMMPTIMTTAVGSDGGMDMTGSRSNMGADSLSSILEAVGDFGLKALEKPHCARMMFCRLAAENLIAESPIMQRAVHLATVAMEDSWLQYMGVQSLLKSLNDGTCNQADCDPEFIASNLVAT
ncbi:uncharacterized protein [Parasteatoda tepidariorum]|uniref:uncharacterized protein n=1 Tax=Parasteatoda tepidariorum TaxID=114398 RepID=UPI001C717FA0|nr:uncharacterized protein LOC107451225 [Parasteatoda tepidariorum]